MDNSKIIPYYRELTDKEKQGVEALQAKLKGTDFENASYNIANLLRFIRARDFDLKAACEMLIADLKWRKEMNVEKITEDDVPNEIKSGKLIILPAKTKTGRPVMILFGGLNNPQTRDMKEAVKFAIFSVEKILAGLPEGTDKKYTLIFERIGASRKNFDREYISGISKMMQQHYPETIENVIVLRSNWLFNLLYKIVKPFIDPRTAQKTKLVSANTTAAVREAMLEFFDDSQLWDMWGGQFKWRGDNTNYLKLFSVPDEEFTEEQKKEVEKEIAQKYDMESSADG